MTVVIARALLTLLTLSMSALPNAHWHHDTQAIMGTEVRVELWHDDAAVAQRLVAAVMAEMQRIDAAYSPYRDDSELSLLNRGAPHGWVSVSGELFGLLQQSRRMSELSDGAFDVTYASAGRYYDYRQGLRPDDEHLRNAVEAIDYRHVELDAESLRVRFARPEVYVDLGGIAKGYAVDLGIDLLRRAGVTQASLSAGGDAYILGDRRGKPWTVGVRDPRGEGMAVVLPVVDTAISTSGDYERYFEENGVRYHHILNPATGESARRSRSVTIIGPQAVFTDALSTSVFVLGPVKGLALIDRLPGVDAIIIDASGRLLYSADLVTLEAPAPHPPDAAPPEPAGQQGRFR